MRGLLLVTLDRKIRRRAVLVASLLALAAAAGLGLGYAPGEEAAAVAQGRLHPVKSVPTREKKLALTFEISWGSKTLPLILEELKKEKVTATFFVSGAWVANNPELLRKIASAGHEVGSMGHRHLNYTQHAREVITENIAKAHELIKEIAGLDPALFRPPNGDYNDRVLGAALELGYTTVLWDVDSLDWRNPGEKQIAARVLAKAHPGAIVQMHASDSAKQTHLALRGIIGELRKKGLEPVTVSELLKLENV